MAHPHNPFGAFAFKSASNTRLTAVPALHDPPADATQPSRRRRRPAQSLPASPAKQQQHQLAPERLPDTTAPKRTTRASIRSSSPSRAPLSSPVAPKKQRKAYASLTGPPKGLGPKLGTAPLRLILVRAVTAAIIRYSLSVLHTSQCSRVSLLAEPPGYSSPLRLAVSRCTNYPELTPNKHPSLQHHKSVSRTAFKTNFRISAPVCCTGIRDGQVGHNPSEHAFHIGHFYSNPSNRMWPILISTGIAPPGTTGGPS